MLSPGAGGLAMALSGARLGKHPIHPMLVVIPLGLWVAALGFDILHAVTGNPAWRTTAFWNIGFGIIGALLAAVPGFVDWLGMTGRVGRLATYHMLLNLGAVAIFAVNWFVRTRLTGDSPWPLILTIVGVIGVGISGWLGGELVYVHRIGVEEEEDRRREARARRVA
jgi:uncharacterized membrane protein